MIAPAARGQRDGRGVGERPVRRRRSASRSWSACRRVEDVLHADRHAVQQPRARPAIEQSARVRAPLRAPDATRRARRHRGRGFVRDGRGRPLRRSACRPRSVGRVSVAVSVFGAVMIGMEQQFTCRSNGGSLFRLFRGVLQISRPETRLRCLSCRIGGRIWIKDMARSCWRHRLLAVDGILLFRAMAAIEAHDFPHANFVPLSITLGARHSSAAHGGRRARKMPAIAPILSIDLRAGHQRKRAEL